MGGQVSSKARVYLASVAKVYELHGSSSLESTEKHSRVWRTWLVLGSLEARVERICVPKVYGLCVVQGQGLGI